VVKTCKNSVLPAIAFGSIPDTNNGSFAPQNQPFSKPTLFVGYPCFPHFWITKIMLNPSGTKKNPVPPSHAGVPLPSASQGLAW
jgi:hypothetical protein